MLKSLPVWLLNETEVSKESTSAFSRTMFFFEKMKENELMALKMLLLLSVKRPYIIHQAPCSGIMSVFPWLRDGLLIRRAGVYKGVSVEPGWGFNFEHDNDPSATPSLETQTQHSECLVQPRFVPCPEQLGAALEGGCPWVGGDSPGGSLVLQELVGIISPDRQLLNLVFA